MAKQMVCDLKVGESVDSVYLVARAQVGTARNGKDYLNLILQDRTGSIPGKVWEVLDSFAATVTPDSFVHVKGKVESYQNQLQVNVRALLRAETDGLRLRDFLPQSEQDAAGMMQQLTELLRSVQDPHLKGLVEAFLNDKEFIEAFRIAPAATSNHHAYLSGLLEHTLSMAKLAGKIHEHYSSLRRDLLLCGVFLHDIGKVHELQYKRSFQYSDVGNLVGHIVLSVLMLEERARQVPGFPPEKLNLLRHMILSHHGEYAFGSPKLPMFAEAQALHYIDNLDAKMNDFAKLIAEDRNPESDWTEYSRQLERRLYKK